MRESELPALERVLSAYFHQDWNIDFADDHAVLDEIVAVFQPEQLLAAAGDIRELLAFEFNDDKLSGVLWQSVGCYFSASLVGLTTRQWLNEVAERFEKASAQNA